LGFVGFDAVNDYKEWQDHEMSLLRLFVELLVNFHIKAKFENSLREAKNLAERKEVEVRSVIDNSPVGIALVSPKGDVIDINQSALTMLAAPSAKHVLKLNIFKDSRLQTSGFNDDFLKCLETKTMVWNENKFTSRWGREAFVKYYLVPIFIDGVIESVLANVEDISNIKETEKKLIALKDKAEESDRLKSAFLANMSHEIRTPMNAICGFSNLLLDSSIADDQKESFVEIININGQQLLSIINDIIDISKIESGQISISNNKFSLNEIFKETETVYAQLAKIRGINFASSLGLPDSESIIVTDEMKLKQIINNIVFNAIKFTEEGKVELGYRLKDEHIEFFVKDSGIGVPLDKYDAIFERFQQVDNASSQSRKGTGLGLAISKAFVEMLGGTIWFKSEVGKGSTFFFTIPYKPGEGKAIKTSPSDDYTYIWKGKTILIAEDDDPNYLYLEQILLPTKAKILWAINGQEAVDICLKSEVDLVLMDLKMPIKSGLEATIELRKHGKKMPIIAQTAYAFSEDKETAIKSGCDYYISKPIERNELLALIDKII
jgi:PAS domain S-box-containing protein